MVYKAPLQDGAGEMSPAAAAAPRPVQSSRKEYIFRKYIDIVVFSGIFILVIVLYYGVLHDRNGGG